MGYSGGKACIVLVTAKDLLEAKRISRQLLKEKLVACVNIVGGIQSLFWWQGKVDKAKETLLVIKTQRRLFSKIVRSVKSKHSYDVPEIIVLSILDGNRDYLRWISESVA